MKGFELCDWSKIMVVNATANQKILFSSPPYGLLTYIAIYGSFPEFVKHVASSFGISLFRAVFDELMSIIIFLLIKKTYFGRILFGLSIYMVPFSPETVLFAVSRIRPTDMLSISTNRQNFFYKLVERCIDLYCVVQGSLC